MLKALPEMKSTPSAVMTEDQARQVIDQLAFLKQSAADVESELAKKQRKLKEWLEAELRLQFEDESEISLDQYCDTLRERLTQFALNQMSVKTLKHGDHQLARRTNPARVYLDDEDQLDTIYRGLLPKLAELLDDTTIGEVDPAITGQPGNTTLRGLYRLSIELDTAAIKASLENGTLNEAELKAIGICVSRGEPRVDITIKA